MRAAWIFQVLLHAVFASRALHKVQDALEPVEGGRCGNLVAAAKKAGEIFGSNSLEKLILDAAVSDGHLAIQGVVSNGTDVDLDEACFLHAVQSMLTKARDAMELHLANVDDLPHFLGVEGDFKTDTPCQTQAECDRAAVRMNKCVSSRKGVLAIYGVMAAITRGSGIVTALMCGCLFIGPMRICPLDAVTPVCALPGSIFPALATMTNAVWIGVKA